MKNYFIFKHFKRRLITQYLYRVRYQKVELFYYLLKLLVLNDYVSKQVKVLGVFYLIFLFNFNSIVLQKNICLQSGRLRGVVVGAGFSRNFFREKVNLTLLPGYRPAK